MEPQGHESNFAPARPAAGAVATVRLPIRLKITAILVATLIGIGAVTIMVTGNQMGKTLLAEFRSKGDGIAMGLATATVSLLMRDDRAKVQTFVEEFSKTDGVAYVAINDASGQVISHSLGGVFPEALARAVVVKEELTNNAELTSSVVETEQLGKVLDISHPIMNGAMGRAHVGMRLNRIDDHLWQLWVRLGLVFLFFVIVGGGVAYFFGRLVVRPLFDIIGVLAEVSRGNLQVEAHCHTRDEFTTLGHSVNTMIASLRDLVSRVRLASVQVNDASEEIVVTSRDQERGVRSQVASLEETSQTMEALASTARAIANNADGLTKLGDEMSKNVTLGQEALAESGKSIAQIVGQNQIIVDRINKLYEQSEAIISVIDIIDSISDRLDLLALNAALEGSRAGEVGRGFSLVAQEMRRLAENVTGSTKEIKSTVQEIHALTQAALEASSQGSDTTKQGENGMHKTVQVMSQIFSLIARTSESARQITVITQQQLSSSEQIVIAVRDVASISNQGMTAAQQVTKAAQELATLSAGLQTRAAVFQLSATEHGGVAQEQRA